MSVTFVIEFANDHPKYGDGMTRLTRIDTSLCFDAEEAAFWLPAPAVIYHAASHDKRAAILAEGLRGHEPSLSRSAGDLGNYGFRDLDDARSYAGMECEAYDDDTWDIWQVDVRGLTLLPDRVWWREDDGDYWGPAYRCCQLIEPARLTLITANSLAT